MLLSAEKNAKVAAPRNRTLRCNAEEIAEMNGELLLLTDKVDKLSAVENKIIHQDMFDAAAKLPANFVDMLFLDPPYNLSKNYNGHVFSEKKKEDYAQWFESVLCAVRHTLKHNASIYVCADWKTSVVIAPVLERFFRIQTRITWEREKGRGAKANWKNNMEDIWFCTVGDDYFFDVDSVKVRRKVVAPYRENGKPKDWQEDENGNYRLTHPSNLWTDISIPFWSMPENTAHPTQKPEKLLAKLLLASTRPGDMIFDPFAGSGTSAVAAVKLRRRFVCVELDKEYCCWGIKRLRRTKAGDEIQGYTGGVFWERNSYAAAAKGKKTNNDILLCGKSM